MKVKERAHDLIDILSEEKVKAIIYVMIQMLPNQNKEKAEETIDQRKRKN